MPNTFDMLKSMSKAKELIHQHKLKVVVELVRETNGQVNLVYEVKAGEKPISFMSKTVSEEELQNFMLRNTDIISREW